MSQKRVDCYIWDINSFVLAVKTFSFNIEIEYLTGKDALMHKHLQSNISL